MTQTDERPAEARRPGELHARELGRWAWRQITSMRTALVLLLVLALAAVPGSVIPQSGVDALNVTRWKDAHPKLTPVYEKLGLFSVYDSPWFSAIYLLLMLSLVGCIVPRLFVYWRGLRAQPPDVPLRLQRLPDHTSFATGADVDDVLERARGVLGKKRYRLRSADATGPGAVSAERGYLREAGNLLFHISVLVVLAGFAVGGLFGYQGGVLLVQGTSFTNALPYYDDFNPGSLFGSDDLDPFSFAFDDFDVDWLVSGPGQVMARKFDARLTYRESLDAPERTYDLRVNHPLTIGDTDLFLIGHGYAPVITVRDGEGNIASSGPTIFLPQDQTFLSFGVIKATGAQPAQIGLEGLLYPTFALQDGDPVTVYPDVLDPLVSMTVYTGDLGLDDGPQSVYILDKSKATQLKSEDGKPFRVDLRQGETAQLPDGLGSVSFDDMRPWARVQMSQTPGKRIALAGVVLALIGLLGSLFIRPRRVWVRARREGGVTMVEVAALDRSGGGDVTDVLKEIVTALDGDRQAEPDEEPRR